MQDKRKTKAQLIAELTELRQTLEAVQQELTEFQGATDTLKESEQIFRELFENSPDAILHRKCTGCQPGGVSFKWDDL